MDRDDPLRNFTDEELSAEMRRRNEERKRAWPKLLVLRPYEDRFVSDIVSEFEAIHDPSDYSPHFRRAEMFATLESIVLYLAVHDNGMVGIIGAECNTYLIGRKEL